MKIDKSNGRHVWIADKRYTSFSTTSYLAIQSDETYKELILEGLNQYCSNGQSPLTLPQLAIYNELESYLAHYYGSETAILCSNGFMAAQIVMQSLSGDLYHIKYGPFRHPALQVEQQEDFNHSVFANDLANPLTGKIFNSNNIPERVRRVVIDASHGFGILDEKVKELVSQGAIVCGSLNKALSTPAGLILCKHEERSQFEQHAMYATSSTPNASACYTLLHLFKTGVIETKQQRLQELVNHAKTRFNESIDFPVIAFSDKDKSLYERLFKVGLLIWHNQYPKNSGQYLNRAVLHAALEEQDIEQLAKILNE